MALLLPQARTILKYALFYHEIREFTENSDHSHVSQYLSVMHTLNDDHLKKWKESSSKKGEDALTALYQIVNKS